MPRDDACANWRWDTDEKQCLTGQPRLFLRTVALSSDAGSIRLPQVPHTHWMQTFQPPVYTSPVLGRIYKRPDRFLPSSARALKKFRNFRHEKRSIYLFTLRETSLIDMKLFYFSQHRDYQCPLIQSPPIVTRTPFDKVYYIE